MAIYFHKVELCSIEVFAPEASPQPPAHDCHNVLLQLVLLTKGLCTSAQYGTLAASQVMPAANGTGSIQDDCKVMRRIAARQSAQLLQLQ